LTATKTFRVWAQGATDQVAHRNYLAALIPHMKACCDPDFGLEFKTMTPSVTTVHALSEHRFSRAVIRGAIAAERENYDVFFMNHFQDVGLYDARASVNIPVLGLGEATLLHACTMGRKLGLLAINPAFIPTHAEQIHRYGLQQRIAGIRAIEASIADYMEAFAAPAKKAELWARFEAQARRLIDAGADIIDVFFDGKEFYELMGKKQPSEKTHGSGCAFSAAICAGLANRLALLDAIDQAKNLVNMAIQYSDGQGRGTAPVNVLAFAPKKK